MQRLQYFVITPSMNKRVVPNEILIPEVGKLLDEGREVELQPKGNSMLPFIRQGKDNVLLKKQEPKKWDIVLARIAPDRYVMHRVIGEQGTNLTLMGDGNIAGYEHCKKEDVLGVVIKIIKNGKKEITPPSGKFWRRLLPIRRYLLGFYRRLFL